MLPERGWAGNQQRSGSGLCFLEHTVMIGRIEDSGR